VRQVIARAQTYRQAIQKMQRALYEFHIRGVKTNILFLENVLRHPEFLSGQATTSFIERHPGLFNFNTSNAVQSSKLLFYLAEMVRPCFF
jgi:pyruvate carboxylase